MGWKDVKDWFWVILAVGWAVLPPHMDPLIRSKARREWGEPRDEWGRGYSARDWSLFVAAIAVIVMLAVVFAIACVSKK